MSRMIVAATTMAALVLASPAATPAKGQVFDLRVPPIGVGPAGAPAYPGAPGAFGPDRYGPVVPTSANRHRPDFPGYPPSIGGHGGHGHPGGHHAPGGFPGGGFPAGPGFGYGAPGYGGACPPGGASPVLGVVDQLIGEVGAFLQVFGPTAHIVPQGERMYRDASSLYESAAAFRQAALAGAPPHELRKLHSRMDSSCRRLVSRVGSVARGRTGPNIEQVRLIGALCGQIRSFL